MKTKVQNAVTLTEDLLQSALEKDQEWKADMIAQGKGRLAVGDSYFVFHLKTLKNLLEEIRDGR